MKPLLRYVGALMLGASVTLAAHAADTADTDGLFRLNELLSTDAEFRDTWQQLLEDEERLPEWVTNLSGQAEPMKVLMEDGDKYLVGPLCDPAQCFQQRLYVAFGWDDKDVQRAYALWVQVPKGLPADKSPSRHATYRWLGEPDEGMQALLKEQLKADPNWY